MILALKYQCIKLFADLRFNFDFDGFDLSVLGFTLVLDVGLKFFMPVRLGFPKRKWVSTSGTRRALVTTKAYSSGSNMFFSKMHLDFIVVGMLVGLMLLSSTKLARRSSKQKEKFTYIGAGRAAGGSVRASFCMRA